jgi:hypothetical protein
MKTAFITHAAAAALTVALAASGQVIAQQQGMQPQGQSGGQAGAQMGGQAGGQTGGQSQQAQTGGGADVRVKEAPADIKVQQDEPDVTVRQPAPDVSITQPEPKVQIQTPEPNVQVEEAEPNVQVTSPGEPEVQVIQTEEPTVRYERTESEQPGQAQIQQQGQGQQQLMSMTADEIKGKNVQSEQGQDMGSVDKIVKDQSNRIHAVISVGGVLGIGAEEIALPLEQLRVQGDQLVAPISGDEEQLGQRYAYQEDRYTEVEQTDVQLSQLAQAGGGAQGGQSLPSFQELDQDNKGYLTQQDVQQHDQISNRFEQIDQNRDQRIDSSEFSAFEQQIQQQGGGQMQPQQSGGQMQQPEPGGGTQMRQPQSGGGRGGSQMR